MDIHCHENTMMTGGSRIISYVQYPENRGPSTTENNTQMIQDRTTGYHVQDVREGDDSKYKYSVHCLVERTRSEETEQEISPKGCAWSRS